MKKTFLYLASVLLLTACSKPYSVTVNHEKISDSTEVYLNDYFTGDTLDSALFIGGKACSKEKPGKVLWHKLPLVRNRPRLS